MMKYLTITFCLVTLLTCACTTTTKTPQVFHSSHGTISIESPEYKGDLIECTPSADSSLNTVTAIVLTPIGLYELWAKSRTSWLNIQYSPSPVSIGILLGFAGYFIYDSVFNIAICMKEKGWEEAK